MLCNVIHNCCLIIIIQSQNQTFVYVLSTFQCRPHTAIVPCPLKRQWWNTRSLNLFFILITVALKRYWPGVTSWRSIECLEISHYTTRWPLLWNKSWKRLITLSASNQMNDLIVFTHRVSQGYNNLSYCVNPSAGHLMYYIITCCIRI